MTIVYRSLHGWKYELLAPYGLELPEVFHDPGRYIADQYLRLTGTTLTAKTRYAWDGPSGPTFDTPSTMRASLVHDALYQMMRLGWLPASLKGATDQLFYDHLREDGMGKVRAWCWYKAVSWFGSVKQG